MSSAEKLESRMSREQYFEWERTQTLRHEFYHGEVFAQAGGTRDHSQIAINFILAVGKVLEGRDCIVHGSDMRIDIESADVQVYPDASVVCPPVEGATKDVISNPVLVAEVLSPSTADFDRGTKFGYYRQIESLQEYLVLWQDEVRAEHHIRTPDGAWLLREYMGLDARLHLAPISMDLCLADVYKKIEFE